MCVSVCSGGGRSHEVEFRCVVRNCGLLRVSTCAPHTPGYNFPEFLVELVTLSALFSSIYVIFLSRRGALSVPHASAQVLARAVAGTSKLNLRGSSIWFVRENPCGTLLGRLKVYRAECVMVIARVQAAAHSWCFGNDWLRASAAPEVASEAFSAQLWSCLFSKLWAVLRHPRLEWLGYRPTSTN